MRTKRRYFSAALALYFTFLLFSPYVCVCLSFFAPFKDFAKQQTGKETETKREREREGAEVWGLRQLYGPVHYKLKHVFIVRLPLPTLPLPLLLPLLFFPSLYSLFCLAFPYSVWAAGEMLIFTVSKATLHEEAATLQMTLPTVPLHPVTPSALTPCKPTNC